MPKPGAEAGACRCENAHSLSGKIPLHSAGLCEGRFPWIGPGSPRPTPHAPHCGAGRGALRQAVWAAAPCSRDPPPSENVPSRPCGLPGRAGAVGQAAGDLSLGLPWSGLSFFLCSLKGLGLQPQEPRPNRSALRKPRLSVVRAPRGGGGAAEPPRGRQGCEYGNRAVKRKHLRLLPE